MYRCVVECKRAAAMAFAATYAGSPVAETHIRRALIAAGLRRSLPADSHTLVQWSAHSALRWDRLAAGFEGGRGAPLVTAGYQIRSALTDKAQLAALLSDAAGSWTAACQAPPLLALEQALVLGDAGCRCDLGAATPPADAAASAAVVCKRVQTNNALGVTFHAAASIAEAAAALGFAPAVGHDGGGHGHVYLHGCCGSAADAASPLSPAAGGIVGAEAPRVPAAASAGVDAPSAPAAAAAPSTPLVPVAVLQEHVPQPLLLRGAKFHCRVNVLCVGCLDVYVHRAVVCHVASAPFRMGDWGNSARHITNHCAQRALPGYDRARHTVSLATAASWLRADATAAASAAATGAGTLRGAARAAGDDAPGGTAAAICNATEPGCAETSASPACSCTASGVTCGRDDTADIGISPVTAVDLEALTEEALFQQICDAVQCVFKAALAIDALDDASACSSTGSGRAGTAVAGAASECPDAAARGGVDASASIVATGSVGDAPPVSASSSSTARRRRRRPAFLPTRNAFEVFGFDFCFSWGRSPSSDGPGDAAATSAAAPLPPRRPPLPVLLEVNGGPALEGLAWPELCREVVEDTVGVAVKPWLAAAGRVAAAAGASSGSVTVSADVGGTSAPAPLAAADLHASQGAPSHSSDDGISGGGGGGYVRVLQYRPPSTGTGDGAAPAGVVVPPDLWHAVTPELLAHAARVLAEAAADTSDEEEE